MSTRATVHFNDKDKTYAIIYVHSDGYPEGLGKDLERFLDDAEKLNDSRFDDPSYLATKFVVWQVNDYSDFKRAGNILDFLGVGICLEDPGDIDYCYTLDCSKGGRPKVKCKKV